MVDPLIYLSLQLVLYDRCNKDRGLCYPVGGMVQEEPTWWQLVFSLVMYDAI